MTRGVKGGVFFGMIITIIAGMIFGLIDIPTKIVDKVPSLEPTFGAVFTSFSDPSFYTSSDDWSYLNIFICGLL